MNHAIESVATAQEGAPAVAHPLDRPVWSALTTAHRRFALGDPVALRYPAQVAPFAAIVDPSPASFEALARLLALEDPVGMVLVEPMTPPEPFEIVRARSLDQMIGTALAGACDRADLVPLGVEDGPEMVALTALTQPGPFAARTHEMGSYLGVRDGGRLVAMAGERMRLDGFTEISAVCTHPDHRGRGHARALVTALVRAVTARGELPFLHVLSENQSAIALYRELGFTLRRGMHFMVVRRSR